MKRIKLVVARKKMRKEKMKVSAVEMEKMTTMIMTMTMMTFKLEEIEKK